MLYQVSIFSGQLVVAAILNQNDSRDWVFGGSFTQICSLIQDQFSN